MHNSITEKLRELSCRIKLADVYPDTQQFVYTNPGSDWPSETVDEIWPGETVSLKDNEPASKKDDEKHKWDTLKLGPGPTQTDFPEKGERPTFLEDVEPPKRNDQGEDQDFVKSKGEYIPDALDREVYYGEGVIDPFNF